MWCREGNPPAPSLALCHRRAAEQSLKEAMGCSCAQQVRLLTSKGPRWHGVDRPRTRWRVSVSLRPSGGNHFLAGSHPSVLTLLVEISSQEFISSEYLKTRVSPCPVHSRETLLAYCQCVVLLGVEIQGMM